MISRRRSWLADGLRRAALLPVCLGLALCTSVSAQDTVAKQSDEPAEVAQEDTSACGACNSCVGNPCGPWGTCGCGTGPYGTGGYATGGYGTGGYGTGGYGTGGYGTDGYGAGAGVSGGGAGVGSFDAFGAAGGAGAAAPGAGAAPYMIGDLLMANRVIQFEYNRVGSQTTSWWAASVDAGAVVNIRNTKVAENNNAIPTDRFAYEYNFFKNGMSVTGTSSELEPAEGYDPWFRYRTKEVGYDVHVHTFAYEKTFACGMGSVEVRMPFAYGLSSNLDLIAGAPIGVHYYADHDPADQFPEARSYNALIVEPTPWNTWGEEDWELMDMSLILKFLLHYDPCRERYIAAGLQLVAPTARDVNVGVTDFYGPSPLVGGAPDLDNWLDTYGLRNRTFQIENQTWALSPFLAMTSRPSQRTFFNGFLQVDIPLGSNHVVFDQAYLKLSQDAPEVDGGGVVQDFDMVMEHDPEFYDDPNWRDHLEGDVADQTLLHFDVAMGYYLYTNPCARVVKAVIPTAEFHLTQTLGKPDRFEMDAGRYLFQISERTDYLEANPVVGNPAGSNTITDVTVGIHSYLGRASMLSVGGVFPLGEGWDRTFDSEIAVKFNHAF